MNYPLLTVIIATYKNGKMLYETIDSIIAQDYPNIELIVAEDGDPPFCAADVEEYIRSHAKNTLKNFYILQMEHNQGTVRNINRALKRASGTYIKIIAGDDTYPNNQVFSRQAEILLSNEETEVVVGNVVECDAQLTPQSEEGFRPSKKEHLFQQAPNELLKCICRERPVLLYTQACCFRKSFFEKCGYYDEKYRVIEDLPMAVRIATRSRFKYLDWPCVNHRGVGGISNSRDVFDAKNLSYYRDLLLCYENEMMPIKNVIGKTFVNQRYRLCKFRIAYVEMSEKGNTLGKLRLVLNNLIPIAYYSIFNVNRLLFHFWRSRK